MQSARRILLFCFLLSGIAGHGQHVEVLDTSAYTVGEGVILRKTSFRGLSVVDDRTIWVSGSNGTIAKSTDGGASFFFRQIPGYEKSDFRDIEAFDDKRAVIMSSGTPAFVLITNDGGLQWNKVYESYDTAVFLDAMDFWDDRRGMIVGDPIDTYFLIMRTDDGGATWYEQLHDSKAPVSRQGEAVFAASGTSLRCFGNGEAVFVSGGSVSRIFHLVPGEPARWSMTAVNAGKPSSGAFSVAVSQGCYYIAGGDYAADTLVLHNTDLIRIQDTGCCVAKNDVGGYRSGIEDIGDGLIACGTTGVDLNAGCTWKALSGEGFHVVRRGKKGHAVFLAGPRGKIGRLIR